MGVDGGQGEGVGVDEGQGGVGVEGGCIVLRTVRPLTRVAARRLRSCRRGRRAGPPRIGSA